MTTTERPDTEVRDRVKELRLRLSIEVARLAVQLARIIATFDGRWPWEG
jgi:hypothetical protein